MVAILRYSICAIACQQWSWVCALNWIDTITHVSEKPSLKQQGMATTLAFQYDELMRQRWCEMARTGHPDMQSVAALEKATSPISEEMMELAKTRAAISHS